MDQQAGAALPRLTPIRLLGLAVIITGVGPVLVRGSPVDPAATAFWRLVFAFPLSLLLAGRAGRLSLKEAGLALLAGLLLACDLVLWNTAIIRTSVMEATVLVMLFPIIVAAIEIGFFGRRLGWRLLAGGTIAFGGTAIIALSASRGRSSLEGDAMAIGAAAFYAVSMLISAHLCQRVDNRAVTPWVIAGGALGALPLLAMETAVVPQSLSQWAYLGIYGTITFASYALYNSALSKLPTTLVAISGYGQPLIATGLAAVLLGEIPGFTSMIGAGIIIAGLLLATNERR
jgi:drug/metabolite transporter (DMT)-like permease